MWLSLRDTLYEAARSHLVPLKPSILPHRPRNQRRSIYSSL